jgi:hypothetical protein
MKPIGVGMGSPPSKEGSSSFLKKEPKNFYPFCGIAMLANG